MKQALGFSPGPLAVSCFFPHQENACQFRRQAVWKRSAAVGHTRSTGQEKWTVTLEVGINSPLLCFLVQLQADVPAVRRLLEQFHGDEGPLLDWLSGQFRPAAQVSHHGL